MINTTNLQKAIDKFNADYAKYVETTGDDQLPTIECTVTGFDPFTPYEYKVFKTFTRVVADGVTYNIKSEADLEEVQEGLRYDKRRLAKAWRIWRSGNPDAELEQDKETDND